MMLPLAKSSQCIKRYEKNPILTSADVPYPSDLVFNAGVVKYQGKYVMVFRNDFDYEGGTCFKGTNLGLAFSEDGLNWKVEKKPFFTQEMITIPGIRRVYDPRITVIDGRPISVSPRTVGTGSGESSRKQIILRIWSF